VRTDSVTFLGFPAGVNTLAGFGSLAQSLMRDYLCIWSCRQRHGAHLNLVVDGADKIPASASLDATVRHVPQGTGVFSLLRVLFTCARNHGYRLIVVADQRAHWAAILFKLASQWPVAIVRLRDPKAPFIRQGGLTHWFHNQWVAVNILPAQADLLTWRTNRPPEVLDIENSVCLEQPGQTPQQVLASTLDALLPSSTRRSHSHIRLSYVTHFYFNQENANGVVDLLRRYAAYSPELLDQIHFVVVDDGSPVHCEIPELNLNLTWLRINEDIRWNQSGARNLGMVYAKSDNVLITDIDHVFPEGAMRELLERGPCGRSLFRIHVKDTPESPRPRHTHPNIFLLSRSRFFEFGGYDEEFAGGYGAEDSRFAKHMQAFGIWLRVLPRQIYCCPREEIDRKRSYHTLFRDHSRNTPIDSRKKLELVYFGPHGGHSRSALNFSWTRLMERARLIPDHKRQPNMAWWGGPARLLRLINPRQQRQN
jgi:hypothetical protein